MDGQEFIMRHLCDPADTEGIASFSPTIHLWFLVYKLIFVLLLAKTGCMRPVVNRYSKAFL